MMKRCALVTGASRGIGQAVALSLAKLGFHVCITARTLAALAETQSLLSAHLPLSHIFPLALDLLDAEASAQAVSRVQAHFGAPHLDVVVNCAVYQGPGVHAPVAHLSLDEVHKCLQGNFVSALVLFQAALPAMLAHNSGNLVQLVSSSSNMRPTRPASEGGWALGYVASKSAVAKILPLLKLEAKNSHVGFFNVEPGLVVTQDMIAKGTADAFRAWGDVPAAVTGEVVARLVTAPQPDAVFSGAPFVYAPKLAHDWGLSIPGFRYRPSKAPGVGNDDSRL